MHQIYAGQRVPKKRKVPKQSLTANFIGNNAKQSQRAKRNTLANRQAMNNTAEAMQDANPLSRLMQVPKSSKNMTRPQTGKKVKS